MIKMTAASVTLSCAAMLCFGACSTEPVQTSDFDTGERVESTMQALSTCVDVQRGLYGTVDDTYITSAAPSSVNGSYVSVYSGQDGVAVKRALLKFDLGFIPADSTIDSATLTLYQSYKIGSSAVNVHRSTASWTEAGASWNNSAGSHDSALAATIDAASGFGQRTANLTALVQSWSDGAANDGVVLEEDLTQRTVFRSSETGTQADKPMLTVCYTAPTCTDGVQNQGETGVDCGGLCNACSSGTAITAPGEAYGHHGMCEGWNGCGDAATCALWACQINGYPQLVSYGASGPCTGFANCNLFYSQDSIQWNWGNSCEVNGVSDIVCSN